MKILRFPEYRDTDSILHTNINISLANNRDLNNNFSEAFVWKN